MEKISSELLSDWENLIIEGELDEVLTNLRAFRNATAYKNEVLVLSSRWDTLSRERLQGVLTSQENERRSNQLNKDLLRLVSALKREKEGKGIDKNLLGAATVKHETSFSATILAAAMLLTGVAIGLVCYFAWYQPAITCPKLVDLNGNWEVFTNNEVKETSLGFVKIAQEHCQKDFYLSGALYSSPAVPQKELDFTAVIAATHEGKIVFNYENFVGEKGTCTGVEPSLNGNEFTVTCIDLIGYDFNDQPVSSFRFKRVTES